MEGLIKREEKPSNTEVLGLLMDKDKLQFITNLNDRNIKGLCKLAYMTKRLQDPKENPIKIHNETMDDYLTLKCSLVSKKGNRAEQIVDALKHIIEDENKPDIQSIAGQIQQ